MIELTEDDSRALSDIAAKHHVSRSAVEHLFTALLSGNGSQAQFNHPELGGMGQWSAGGMTMVGDMFNSDLKAKVARLCTELAELSRNADVQRAHSSAPSGDTRLFAAASRGNWWPDSLGQASSTGAQNDLRYAVFPASRRLAIDRGGHIKIYDTGDHRITGFSQQQGSEQSIAFTSQHGPIRLAELAEAAPEEQPDAATPHSTAPAAEAGAAQAAADKPASSSEHDIFAKIERLADLHAKGILQDEEFQAKKRELLDRL